VCENNTPVSLANANPSGGVYSGVGVASGVFSPINGSGDYLITYDYTDSHGCMATDDYYLHVNSLPTVNLGTDTVTCADNSIVLIADTSYVNYLWSTGAFTPSIGVDSSGIGIGQAQVWVTVTDVNGCINSDTINITFDLCSGIDDGTVVQNGIEMYPNPFSENFYFRSDEFVSYFIYDINGKLIDSRNEFSGFVLLGGNYSPGIYLVDVHFRDQRKVVRLIKAIR
jgi:hypothetical protein